MRILINGFGSIGQRHARLIYENFPEHEIFAFRTGRGKLPIGDYVHEASSWHEVAAVDPDVAFICDPTYRHIGSAIWCLCHNTHLFIEKPIGYTRAYLDNLIDNADKAGRTAYIAYPMRFHPLVPRMTSWTKGGCLNARATCSSYLPDWRPGPTKDYYSAHENKGGGVLLDMSHHAYLMEQLLGPVEKLKGIRKRQSDVTVDTDDTCDLILEHESGVVSTVHVDFITKGAVVDEVVITNEKGLRFTYDMWLTPQETDQMYLDQLNHFFANLDNPNLAGNLRQSAPLFRKIIELREEGLN